MSDRALNPQMVVLMTEIPPGSLIRLISITHNLENDPFQHIPDYIGRFSETYEPNSIKVDDPDKRNGCVWFVSENNKWSRWQEYWADVDEAHKNEAIKKHGSLKAAIYHYAQEDCKRFKDFYNGKWYYLVLTVTAKIEITINGSVLSSTIYESLGGIESDSSQSYIDEAISEVINIMKTQLLTLGFTEDDINEAQKRS